MGRAPCCDERVALKKGPWTPDEDQKLVAYIQEHGHGSWRALPEKAGLARCGKSCRLRWTNYLRPDIKRGRFSHDEDQMIIQLHAILGNRWSAIASHLPRRTDNEIKNYWNTHLKKRLAQMGIDPVTHKTSAAGLALSPAWTPLVSTQLTHTTQWHCALAEAEGRLSKAASRSSLSEQLIQGSGAGTTKTTAPHPSSLFMRSWKTKVEDTLRPTFGAVKLEPQRPVTRTSTSASPQKTRQDWNAALGIQTLTTPTPSPFLEQYSAMVMKNAFPSPTEVQMRESPNVFHFASNSESVGLENHFSPTSILQGPDSDDSCSGSGDSDNCKFEFLHVQDHGSGISSVTDNNSFHSFPLIDEHTDSASMMTSSDIPESFWQATTLLEELKSIDTDQSEAEGLSELMIIDPNLSFGPNNVPFESINFVST